MYRYADEWIVLVRGTKQQAQAIKEEGKAFLQEEMGLELSEEKTTITHVEDGFDSPSLSHLSQQSSLRWTPRGNVYSSDG